MAEVALVGGITALAFWRNDLFIWFLAMVIDTAFGFYWASTGSPGDRLWVEGIAIVVLGGFCLMRALMILIGRGRRQT